ncbi:MAG: DUF2384 domain-containing protein [Parcubacteria group bacterium]|nr:DUF2384 domain-containing protein [Parcubacteria group bacterium]
MMTVREQRRIRVIEAMGNMISVENREKFFRSPHPLFDNRYPESMLDSEEETQLLIKNLLAAESGGFV